MPPAVLYVTADHGHAKWLSDELAKRDMYRIIHAAHSGAAMRNLTQEDDIQCLLVGDTLPDPDQKALLETVNAKSPHLPVLFYPKELPEHEFIPGMTGYLERQQTPEHISRLADVIQTAVQDQPRSSGLRERLKELDGLRKVIRTLSQPDTPIEEVMQPIGSQIKNAFRYPEQTGVRLIVGDQTMTIRPFAPDDIAIEITETTVDETEISLAVSLQEDLSVLPEEEQLVNSVKDLIVTSYERRQYLHKLEESERRFQQVANNIKEVVWMTDTEKNEMLYVNPAYETVWGESVESLEAEPTKFLDAIHPDDRPQVDRATPQQMKGTYDETYRIIRPDGEVRWIHDRAVPIEDESGNVSRVVGLAEDITERKERDQQLAVLNRVLRHNLRNELNIVLGHAETLKTNPDPDIASAGADIETIVRGLLAMTDKQRAIAELLGDQHTPEEQDIAVILTRVAEKFRNMYPDATITVSPPDPGTVTTTPHLEMGIVELVDNALRHHDDETPTVDISATVSGETTTITVCDDGPGIPREEYEVLHDDERPLYHGSGIGLWLVRWIVDHTKGQLEFESNEPRGTIVRITIPQSE